MDIMSFDIQYLHVNTSVYLTNDNVVVDHIAVESLLHQKYISLNEKIDCVSTIVFIYLYLVFNPAHQERQNH